MEDDGRYGRGRSGDPNHREAPTRANHGQVLRKRSPIPFFWSLVWVFLNAYRNNPQAHGITVIAFHLELFRVSYFHEERICKSLLASSPKVTRRKIARVARFSRDRDPKLR